MEAILMKELRSFIELLVRESEALSELVRLEDKKYDALKQVEVQNLMRINASEEEILHKLGSIERKRKNILIALSESFHFDQNISLSELLNFLPEKECLDIKSELSELKVKIKNLTDKLQVTMHENSEMIKSNLEIINLTLNFANKSDQKETYDYRNKKEKRDNIHLVNQIA